MKHNQYAKKQIMEFLSYLYWKFRKKTDRFTYVVIPDEHFEVLYRFFLMYDKRINGTKIRKVTGDVGERKGEKLGDSLDTKVIIEDFGMDTDDLKDPLAYKILRHIRDNFVTDPKPSVPSVPRKRRKK